MLHVGVDPGKTVGFAVMDRGQLVEVSSMKLHRAFDRVRELHAQDPVIVHFEDARLRTWFGKMDAEQRKYGAAVREGAGAAKRDAVIWQDFLIDMGIEHRAIKPMAGKTKMDNPAFRRLTGWKGKTNEHARDAACILMYSTEARHGHLRRA